MTYSTNNLTFIKQTVTKYKNQSKLKDKMKHESYMIPDIKYATN